MTEMGKHVRTTIRYDGAALANHEIDVRDLAPALIALADIVQIANRKFNDDRAEIRVLVNADVEQRCFMIDISLVMSFLDHAKSFFDADRVKTAKEIADWLGIIAGAAGTTAGGIWTVWKLLSGRDRKNFQIEIEGDIVAITTPDGNKVKVARETYALATDKDVQARGRTILKPLEQPGYESLSFLQNDDEIVEVDEDEAERILASDPLSIEPQPTESIAQISGPVRIKSPQYEGAAKWAFMWQGRAIDAEMSGAAAEWVLDFQENRIDAPPNTVLDVVMTERVKLDKNGEAIGKAQYTVTEVRSVTPPATQPGLI